MTDYSRLVERLLFQSDEEDGPTIMQTMAEAAAAISEQAKQMAALELKARLLSDHDCPNQPLVDDLERFRRAAITAQRQERGQAIRAMKEKARADRYEAAIRWALGEEGEFGEEPEPLAGKYRQRYWWRTELRKRAALSAPADASDKEGSK